MSSIVAIMINLWRNKNLKGFSAKLIYLLPEGSHYFFHLWQIFMVQYDFLLYQFKVVLIFTLFKMVWSRLQSGMAKTKLCYVQSNKNKQCMLTFGYLLTFCRLIPEPYLEIDIWHFIKRKELLEKVFCFSTVNIYWLEKHL